MSTEPHYPVTRLLARHGVLVSWLAGVIVFAVGALAVICGASLWVGPAALLAAAAVTVFVRSYVELVQIISDTLLPR
jgi:hypothetical protein